MFVIGVMAVLFFIRLSLFYLFSDSFIFLILFLLLIAFSIFVFAVFYDNQINMHVAAMNGALL